MRHGSSRLQTVDLVSLTARLRRAALAAGVGLFAAVQVLTPLLHTHVSASAAALQSGIHLPVALVHNGHDHRAVGASEALLLEEADAITAPPEHRRDDLGLPVQVLGMAVHGTPGLVPARAAFRDAAAFGDTRRGSFRPLPPAQAPPATA